MCPAASSSSTCGCGAAALCALPPPHLYADGINGQISVFPVDRVTGALGTPTSVSGPTNSLGIAALNDQFLYVSNFGLGGPASIDAWSIDSSTGTLTPAPSFSLGPLSIAAGLAIDFNNQILYVADAGKIDALQANATTGTLIAIPQSPFPSGANLYLTIDPTDQFLFASVADPPGGVAAFTIDSLTGALVQVAGSPFRADPNSTVQPGQIVVDPSGKFVYVTLVQSSQVAGFSITTPSGALTPVPGSPFPAGNGPLTLTTSRNFLYVANLMDETLSGYTIDSASGMLTPLANSPFPIPAGAITSDTFGGFLFVSGTGGMTSFKVDVTSGALTQVGSPVPSAGATALTYVP
ncbi:MAG: lactonase family protein [Acidobacteriia bacterium]|nr:lactonase family protein [Terriglobia bacterium]